MRRQKSIQSNKGGREVEKENILNKNKNIGNKKKSPLKMKEQSKEIKKTENISKPKSQSHTKLNDQKVPSNNKIVFGDTQNIPMSRKKSTNELKNEMSKQKSKEKSTSIFMNLFSTKNEKGKEMSKATNLKNDDEAENLRHKRSMSEKKSFKNEKIPGPLPVPIKNKQNDKQLEVHHHHYYPSGVIPTSRARSHEKILNFPTPSNLANLNEGYKTKEKRSCSHYKSNNSKGESGFSLNLPTPPNILNALHNIITPLINQETGREPSEEYLPPPPTSQKKISQKEKYPINIKNEEIAFSQKERIREMKGTVQNSDKIRSDGTIPIKLVLVGDGSVGKTSMLISYTTDNFPTDYVPTIFDNYVADVRIGEKKVQLWLWDTAGQEEFAQLRLISYQKADIFMICFSMIDQNSFHNALNKWFPEVQEESPKAIKIFVGTKSDMYAEYLEDPQNLHQVIPLQYIEKKCQEKKCLFMPCSGLNQKGLTEVFTKSMMMVIDRVDRRKKEADAVCQMI